MARDRADLEAEAARWHLRQTQRSFSERDSRALRNWLNLDPANAVAFARASRAWDLMEGLKTTTIEDPVPTTAWITRRAAAAGLAAAICGGIWFSVNRTDQFRTAIGEQRRVRLKDGSWAMLNTDSEIEVAYGRRSLTVRHIRGEVAFDVAKQPGHEFRVLLDNVELGATAASFALRFNGLNALLMVINGLVELATAGDLNSKSLIRRGFAASIGNRSVNIMKIRTEELQRLLSWRLGVLEFNGQTVEQIVDEFNRYNRTQLVVSDRETARLRFGGRFGTNEALQFVDALCSGFPVRAIHGRDGTIYLASRS